MTALERAVLEVTTMVELIIVVVVLCRILLAAGRVARVGIHGGMEFAGRGEDIRG